MSKQERSFSSFKELGKNFGIPEIPEHPKVRKTDEQKRETPQQGIRVSDLCRRKRSDEETYLLVAQQKHQEQWQKTQDTVFETSQGLDHIWGEILALDRDAMERGEAESKIQLLAKLLNILSVAERLASDQNIHETDQIDSPAYIYTFLKDRLESLIAQMSREIGIYVLPDSITTDAGTVVKPGAVLSLQEVRPLFENHFATVAVEGVVKRDYTDYPRWQVMNTGKIGVRKDKQGNRIYFALIQYKLLPYKKQE